jgi:hypothetical protein
MKMLLKLPLRYISQFLFLFPNCLFLLQRTVLRVAAVFDVVIAFRLIKRPEWLLLKGSEHQAKLVFTLPVEPSISDIALAERNIATYSFAKNNSNSGNSGVALGTIWDTLLQTHYARLHFLLESGQPKPLAKFFNEIFQTETVNGYTNGTTFNLLPHRWWTFATAIEVSLVSLAEAVGVARSECPEQGVIGHSLQPNATQLIEKLEKHFGFRIEAPNLGGARGVVLGDRFLSREVCSQIYTAYRIRQVLNARSISAPLHIVEVGGGYGGLCLWLHRMLGERIASYTIVDLPITNAVQAYFLSNTLEREVLLYGNSAAAVPTAGVVRLVPHFALSTLSGSYNLLLNQDSMPELPVSEVDRYVSWANENINGLFFSFNQEAYSVVSGTPQVLLPEVVSKFANYGLLERHTSWDRRGYVEEVYSVAQPQPQQQAHQA